MDFGISDDEDEAEVKDADNGEVSEWHLLYHHIMPYRIVYLLRQISSTFVLKRD